tara:strand:+ start:5418 stop:5831 length:414 start_codon:yes stop_codon:yes gene_type:complete
MSIGETIPSILKARDALRLRRAQHQQELLERQAGHNETLRETLNRRDSGDSLEERGDQVGDITVDSPIYNIQEPKPVLGTLAKLAIGAALVGSGAAIPAGGSMILDVIRDRQTTKQAERPDQGTSTTYTLDLGDPVD